LIELIGPLKNGGIGDIEGVSGGVLK